MKRDRRARGPAGATEGKKMAQGNRAVTTAAGAIRLSRNARVRMATEYK